MIAGFKVSCEFDVGEFLSRELRDREFGGQKALLGYLCIITLIFLAAAVLELLEINKMIEARRKFDIGLIRDETNPLA